jgi:hypothetical protein
MNEGGSSAATGGPSADIGREPDVPLHGPAIDLRSAWKTSLLAALASGVLAIMFLFVAVPICTLLDLSMSQDACQPNGLAWYLTRCALKVAGRRRSRLGAEWRSDLYDTDGRPIPVLRQLRHVAGYMIAAVRYRLVNDLGDALGRLLDAILVSRTRTRAVVVPLLAIPVAMVFFRQGLYGLIANAGSLGVLGGGLWAAVRGLRAWRNVQLPRPTEREDRQR